MRLQLPVDVERRADGTLRLRGSATVSRSAVGLGWNMLGAIRDEAKLHADLMLTKTAPAR